MKKSDRHPQTAKWCRRVRKHETEANAHSLVFSRKGHRTTPRPEIAHMRRAWPRADIRSCRDELLRSSVCATTNPGTPGREIIIAGCPQVPMGLGARRSTDVMRAGLIFGIGCCANSPTRGTSVRSSHVREGTRYDPRTQVRTDPRRASRHATTPVSLRTRQIRYKGCAIGNP